MKQGHIFFIMGTAGAGKGTFRKALEKENTNNLEFIKSYVSRPMREGEVDGDVYHFISEETFKKMITNEEFLEYEFVHKAAYYGTRLSDTLKDGIEVGKNVIKEIEIEGLKSILKNHPHLLKNMTSIFLSLTSEKLSDRIQARGATMSVEDFQNRAESLKKEVREAKEYCDYIIDTSDLTPEEVFEKAKAIIEAKL